jgi:hypothetical protein
MGDALTARGARPIGGLVRAAAGGAAKWCMRAFAASRATQDLARMLSRNYRYLSLDFKACSVQATRIIA